VAKKASTSAKKGLSVKTFKGLNKKRMEQKSNKNFGKRLMLKDGDTVPVQFLMKPEDFLEFEQHQWQEGRQWNFVPCLGDGCPLCESESDNERKTTYRFIACVYNLKDKKVQIVEGPKDLAGRIFYRYERKPANFLKATFELTRFPTSPTTYACDKGDDDPVKTSGMKIIDLDEYVLEEAKRYFGDDMPAASALDADDDDDFEDDDDLDDDEDSEDDDLDDDEDDDDEDDDEDDDSDDDDEDDEDDDDDLDDDDDDDEDDDDEDDEPVAPKKATKKAAPAKKAPAKKAPAKAAASKGKKSR
jgi:hypothetical protein